MKMKKYNRKAQVEEVRHCTYLRTSDYTCGLLVSKVDELLIRLKMSS